VGEWLSGGWGGCGSCDASQEFSFERKVIETFEGIVLTVEDFIFVHSGGECRINPMYLRKNVRNGGKITSKGKRTYGLNFWVANKCWPGLFCRIFFSCMKPRLR